VRLDERDCGFALGKVGLTLHLHHSRSYKKFTSDSMGISKNFLRRSFPRSLEADLETISLWRKKIAMVKPG